MFENFGPFSLQGRNILITGASSGIGEQCAISCSQMGANIILIARNEERLQRTFENLQSGNHLKYSFDITNFSAIEGVISDAVLKNGKISGFVHSAGVELTMPFAMTKPEHFINVFNVNVFAGFEISRIISKKKFFHDQGGSLVFISSIMGLLSRPGLVAYSSSKAALIGGVKTLALELAPRKIKANALLPAYVLTEMTKNAILNLSDEFRTELNQKHPLGMGNPEDIANACVFLLSDASRWITGSELVIDGGYSIS